MPVPFRLVNAFSTDLQGGNPAAVCLLPDLFEADNAWYQTIAQQLGQPVTAFCQLAGGEVGLRWFTPTRELALCGHGTLAAAHVLYEETRPDDAAIEFRTLAGIVPVRRDGDQVSMSLPATALTEAPVPAAVLEALRIDHVEWFGSATDDGVVVLESNDQVLESDPDVGLLAHLPWLRTTVTAPGAAGYDCVSRVFTPRIGVAEDQVTGTAHAALGPYWAQRLGKQRLLARQASARGGALTLDLGVPGEVRIAGSSVTVAHGRLLA